MRDDLREGRSGGATITPDMRWMTYKEMAEFLGMKEESARRRAQRDGWPRQLGNDGRTRVGVPGDAVAGEGASSGAADGGDHPGETAALRDALARERERADRAEAAAAAIPELRERAGRAEGESATLREQIKAERLTAEMRIRGLEEARVAAEAELAEWSAGGPLARAWRALAYRRG